MAKTSIRQICQSNAHDSDDLQYGLSSTSIRIGMALPPATGLIDQNCTSERLPILLQLPALAHPNHPRTRRSLSALDLRVQNSAVNPREAIHNRNARKVSDHESTHQQTRLGFIQVTLAQVLIEQSLDLPDESREGGRVAQHELSDGDDESTDVIVEDDIDVSRGGLGQRARERLLRPVVVIEIGDGFSDGEERSSQLGG